MTTDQTITTTNTTSTAPKLRVPENLSRVPRQLIREYHYLTVSQAQHDALQEQADERGVSMSALVKAAMGIVSADGVLDGCPLNLPNPGGVINVSLGVRSNRAEMIAYERAAKAAKLKRPDWERSQLFVPGVIKVTRRIVKDDEELVEV
ncbi:hypothetical protein [Citricoccus nitrophenolicus]|uniref:hypothetical protein n=1 Tax=Citricoccus nitrophenolicus TaxID=863575 RepID=UPI0031EF860D